MSAIFRRDQTGRYEPRTADEIAEAARDLAAAGHSDHTISSILRLDVAAVRQMIGPRPATEKRP